MSTVKIYFNNTPLILKENIESVEENITRHFNDLSESEIKMLISEMLYDNAEPTTLTGEDFGKLFQYVRKQFEIVYAGGGIVFNNEGAVLLIFRRGKWDLPKGKLDEGESIATCALREVEEETGLSQLSIKKFSGMTWHVYQEKGKLILKETHWYEMDCKGIEKLIPQEEEGISKAIWVNITDLHSYMENTYPSIKEILKHWKTE